MTCTRTRDRWQTFLRTRKVEGDRGADLLLRTRGNMPAATRSNLLGEYQAGKMDAQSYAARVSIWERLSAEYRTTLDHPQLPATDGARMTM
jgi:hypothetical protein